MKSKASRRRPAMERSRAALLKTLRVTLGEALEFNRAEARRAAGEGYEELTIAP